MNVKRQYDLEIKGQFLENMKREFIEKIFKASLVSEEFINVDIEDIYKKTFVAGGAIYSLYNNKEIKDIDIFFKDEKVFDEIKKMVTFCNPLKYVKGIKTGKYGEERLLVTDNAITIGKYQLIGRWYGDPIEVVSMFDFKHNMFYVEDGVVHNVTAWKYLDSNKLVFNDERARDICGCIIRSKKFVERGFELTNQEMANMLLKLNEVGFNERELEILNINDGRNNFGSGD